ncbi:ecto-ADP-ribosyltransferase 5-like [Scomber japonicus]|uniref:ecto-ADP-ribosyltransferase 5-like n=1 Tax=Scomber japonicus TaxID=13676 RepID=UPI002305E859|nr:ecto-ADP-ribosyltransferase 5-like [Scomber japonicus]
MKALLLILAPVLLLPCWMAMDNPSKTKTYPLGMAPDAVDDMYLGCKDEMEKIVNEKFLKLELEGDFKKAWEDEGVVDCSKQKPDKGDEALTENHMHAICAYTSTLVYKQFNKACKTGKDFKFYTLHYWLTTAIQILNPKQTCQTTYRRNGSESTGTVGDIIRFGIFASSSYSTEQKSYGTKTCFEIKTCHGAYLKHYSILGTKEQEVLIPPYEKFQITKIIVGKGEFDALPDCEKVFVLKSAGKESWQTMCNKAKL